MKFINRLKKISFPNYVLGLILVVYIITNFSHHKWNHANNYPRGVIVWDVISYYAYLPAFFIHHDLSLDFLDEPGFKNNNHYWFVKANNGNKVILTTMGVSAMYSPFFFMAHITAKLAGVETDGYGPIYELFLVFSALFYTMIAYVIMKKFLSKYFSPLTAGITLLLIALGTNLYYYSTHEAAMSHAFSFSLIVYFTYNLLKWFDSPSLRKSLLIGFLYGLLVLVRPTNIVVGIFFLIMGVKNLETFKDRIMLLLRKWYLVVIMILVFIAVWIPQFIYWYNQTGHLFYNAYNEVGSAFFFDSPHITDVLFSYRKGLFLYVPVVFISVIGIYELIRTRSEFTLAVLVYFLIMLYIFASWWSWWNGGSYGPRLFVDLYGVLALPLAALVFRLENSKRKFRIAGLVLGGLLLAHSYLQTKQYTSGHLHFTGTTKTTYWKQNIFRTKKVPEFWKNLSIPDYYLARRGVYYYYSTGEDFNAYSEIDKAKLEEKIARELESEKNTMKEISRYARNKEISEKDAMIEIVEHIATVKQNGGPR